MKIVHLVQHTHWDREWYFTENDSKAVLYYFMDDLMSRLESDPNLAPFVLDAQTVVLEDYFDVAPENKDRLEKLIKKGRILIGPWYSQTDFLVVSAESITRNLLLGHDDASEYGTIMNIGYVPDSFGQSAQLPMFLQQFNIDRAVIWRGWCEHDVNQTEFIWHSDDGSKVTTAVLPWGYGCAKWLSTTTAQALPVIKEKAAKQNQFSATEHILLPNGNDQSPFEYQVPAMFAELNSQQQEYHFQTSSFSEFFNQIEKSSTTLQIYQGEFLSPKYMRIHRGIFSTRMDIKLLNARLEKYLSQYLEPLLTVNWSLGLPYPEEAINTIWRNAMKSHAHDSIGGCNSDRVNAMVKDRLLSGLESIEQYLDINLRKLSEGIQACQDGTKVVIFNSLPHKRSGIVSLQVYTPEPDFRLIDEQGNECVYQILSEEKQDMSTIIQELSNSTEITWYRKCKIIVNVKNIPACGYLTLYLQEGKKSVHSIQEKASSSLENEWLKLQVEPSGQLTLLDKRINKEYKNILKLVDGGDAGDNYNFSPPEQDWLIDSDGCLVNYSYRYGALDDRLELSYSIPVPQDKIARSNKQSNANLIVNMTVVLAHNDALLDVNVDVENTVCDHRLQVWLPTGIVTDVHQADQPFGLIERKNTPPEMSFWRKEQWNEAPVALYPMQSLVMLNDGNTGLCAVTDGIREYEIPEQHTDTIALTLLRSVGWLGLPNMPYRPGRASGMVLPSPDSQIQGKHSFHFAIIPQVNGVDTRFWQTVENWKTPLLGFVSTDWARFRMNRHGNTFPHAYSLLNWDTPLHFSTLKKAQKQNKIVVRAFNPTRQVQASTCPQTKGTACYANLAEQPNGDMPTQTGVGAPATFIISI